MSQVRNWNNGKSVDDLEKAIIEMEKFMEKKMNKPFINRMLKGFSCIMFTVQRKETGIFNVILKWFRLYLKVYISISPGDKKLVKYYENSVPTIITYMIGCLQYKTKEIPNYHYNLLEILEELLESVQPEVLNEITKFEIGTIGCLWNPIDLAGDFNTQSKALKILTILLKQFDEVRQNEELKCIKWTNLNLFQDKLKTIVQETKLSHILENSTRELLNNYNMNLSKNVLVYSFYCDSVVLDNKYTFYKPLNLQKFWIDINYGPKTLTYKARFKLSSKSKYENIDVILKVQMMKLEKNVLLIFYKNPGEFSKFSKYLLNVTNNVLQFTLTKAEAERLKNNNYVIEYFNNLSENSNVKHIKADREDKAIFDLLKNEMSTNMQDNKSIKPCHKRASTPQQIMKPGKPSTSLKSQLYKNITKDLDESPKTSRNLENELEKHPIRKLRNRNKFFTSLITKDSDEEMEKENKTAQRKTFKNKKPRQKNKTRSKQICKVTPTVDLNKIEKVDTKKQNMENSTPKIELPLVTTQECAKVLKQVADIYNIADSTYAKPCQSYRNYKTQQNSVSQQTNINGSSKAKGRKKKVDKIDNESSVEKIRKLTQENKENINPQNPTSESKIRSLPKTKSIISPHLFETQCSDETPPIKQLPPTIENDRNTYTENLQIDLTLDEIVKIADNEQQKQCNDDINNENISSCDSIECEEVRGLNEYSLKDLTYICTPTKSILYNSSEVTTPRPTSCMNISDMNDSDMEITRLTENHNVAPQTNDLNMDITNIANTYPNCNMERQTEIEGETINRRQSNFQVLNENVEVSNGIQQILKDFEGSSDDKFHSNYETPNFNMNDKQAFTNVSAERDYYKDCVIFQKRIDDAEDSASTEEDCNYNEINHFQTNSERNTNQNIAIKQNMPLYPNLWTTPDKKDKTSTKLTTTMATKCQVTPTAIIMHQIQVSAKKSIILRNKKPRKGPKAIKSLNGYFQNINAQNELTKLPKKTVAFYNRNSNNFHERCSQNKVALTGNKASNNNSQNKQANLPVTLQHQLLKTTNRNYFFNPIIYDNPYETPSTAVATQTQYNYNNSKQRSSPCNSNMTEDSESNYFDSNKNTSSNFMGSPFENTENTFKSDLLQILNDFNTNIQLRLNNAQRLCLNNLTSLYTKKICEIAQAVLKKSDEQKDELEKIRCNIGRLVRELEWQYDKFINKSKQFDFHKEMTERVLASISHTDIPDTITKDYEELIKQINIEQNRLVKKVWQRYLETKDKQ